MSSENAKTLLYPSDCNIVVRVVFLYVGQGECTLLFIRDGNNYKTLLVDINKDSERGGIDVIRLLHDLLGDEGEVNVFINTHPHEDHLKGIDQLAEDFIVREVWHSGHKPGTKYDDAYKELMKLVDKAKEQGGEDAATILLGSDSMKSFADASYYILAPAKYVSDDIDDEDPDARYARIHEQCAVLRFGHSNKWILLTGDADRDAFEKHITQHHKDRLPSTVLSASHHGSRTFFKYDEDDDPYLDALETMDPSSVVVSAPTEKESPHDHPHPDAIKLYADQSGEDNVFKMGDKRESFIFDIYEDGSDGGIISDDGKLAEIYGLEESTDELTKASGNGPFKAPLRPGSPSTPGKYGH